MKSAACLRRRFRSDHAAAAARAGAWQLALIIGGCLFLGPFDNWRNAQELAKPSDVGGAIAIGKQPIVADAVEPLGQHVDQESADELEGGERHRLPAVGAVDAVVLPTEGDAVVVGRDQTAIGDRDAVGISDA
jgi:hypothetical protein